MCADNNAPRVEHVAGNVCLVPIDCLRTSYSSLRPGRLPPRGEQGAELPLRVAPCADTAQSKVFEVLDGYKRLQRWREHGATVVPVVVETPAHAVQHKRLMLAVNAPARTTTALDEARVVCSLVEDDGLTPTQVARLLARKPDWVARRRAIGTRLSASVEAHLASSAMGPALAHALTLLPHDEQDALLDSIRKHALGSRDSLMLVGAWRAASPADRTQLLRAPLERLRRDQAARPTLSPRATHLEAELHRIRRALADLAAFQIPAELAPAEQRRLEALHRAALGDVQRLATNLGPSTQPAPIAPQENAYDRYRPTEPDCYSDSTCVFRRNLATDSGVTWPPIPDGPGQHSGALGQRSGALGHGFRSTWTAFRTTWPRIPEHLDRPERQG